MRELGEYSDLIGAMRESISQIDAVFSKADSPVVVYVGRNVAFRKGQRFINALISGTSDAHWMTLSEYPLLSQQDVTDTFGIKDVMIPIRMPMSGCYDKNMSVRITPEIEDICRNVRYVAEAVANVKWHFYNMGENYPELICWYLYSIHKRIIKVLKESGQPFTFVMWGEGPPSHHILKNICLEESIPVRFLEFGVVAGTISMESFGQIGRSEFAVDHERYFRLRTDREDLKRARGIIDISRNRRLNRKDQMDTSEIMATLLTILKPKRPIVVFYMMDDFESCIIPWTEKNRAERSPMFGSSREAADYLVGLSEKYGWNLILKPHPLTKCVERKKKYDPRYAIWLEDMDINDLIDLSDVSVTLYSQVSFDSLIRGKPVVMMGYNQLRGQGCTYECYDRSELEGTILRAIKKGYTRKQRRNFEKALAKLCYHSNIFDSLEAVNDIPWGRPIDPCVESLKDALEESARKSISGTTATGTDK